MLSISMILTQYNYVILQEIQNLSQEYSKKMNVM